MNTGPTGARPAPPAGVMHVRARLGIRRPLPRHLGGLLRRFRADTAGAVAVIIAVMAPVLIGAMGLGAEVGYWYLIRRNLQNAADVAAYAAASRLSEGASEAELRRIAGYLVDRSGAADAAVDLDTLPATDPDPHKVGVIVTRTVPRLFSAIYSDKPIRIRARAVARAEPGVPACVLALGRSGSDGITIDALAGLDLDGCGIASNAPGVSVRITGSADIDAACIQTVGAISVVDPGSIALDCGSARERAGAVADPFAALPEPVIAGPCDESKKVIAGTSLTLTPTYDHPSGMKSMLFCDGLEFTGSGAVNLDPGLYIVKGGNIVFTGSVDIHGDGVMLYLARGVELHMNSSSDIVLSPPTSGAYAGITFFSSRNSTGLEHAFAGGSETVIGGTIYAPTSALRMTGSNDGDSARCVRLIADTLTFTGALDFGMRCPDPIAAPISLDGEAALVE